MNEEIENAKQVVIDIVTNYINNMSITIDCRINKIKDFKNGILTLKDLGICNIACLKIDDKLHEINEDFGVFYTDTITKMCDDFEKTINQQKYN